MWVNVNPTMGRAAKQLKIKLDLISGIAVNSALIDRF